MPLRPVEGSTPDTEKLQRTEFVPSTLNSYLLQECLTTNRRRVNIRVSKESIVVDASTISVQEVGKW